MSKARTFEHIDTNSNKRLLVETSNGLSDWPIRYDNGNIAYNYPELIPNSIKNRVRYKFDLAIKQGRQYHNDYLGKEII